MGLATITALVDDKLRSASLGDELAPAAARGRAIEQAVLQYGLDAPQRLHEDFAGITGAQIPLPAAWVAGRSMLDAVEHPVGQAPRAELDAAVVLDMLGDTMIVLADDQYLADALVRVHFSAPQVCTVNTSTIPLQHENALACWAAAELCRQLATAKGGERDATISAAAGNGSTQSSDLARRAKDWFAQYRQALGLPDPEARSAALPAGTLLNWRADDRPRPRFYSTLG